jgi:hypothetical protein
MPKYSISAPDGHTYTVEAPEGATQEDVAREVLAQHPEASIPASNTLSKPPTTASVIQQPSSMAKVTTMDSTMGVSILSTIIGLAIAGCFIWLITKNIWKKQRVIPHENGLWYGSFISAVSIALGVSNLSSKALTIGVSPEDWYKYGVMWSFTLPIIWFIIGYTAGWGIRYCLPLSRPEDSVTENASKPNNRPPFFNALAILIVFIFSVGLSTEYIKIDVPVFIHEDIGSSDQSKKIDILKMELSALTIENARLISDARSLANITNQKIEPKRDGLKLIDVSINRGPPMPCIITADFQSKLEMDCPSN